MDRNVLGKSHPSVDSSRKHATRAIAYDYVASVLHDLRNPLSATAGNLLYAREGLTSSATRAADLAEALEDAQDAVHRVEVLLDELGSVAQEAAGVLQLRPEPFDLSVVVRQCVDEAQREAKLRRVQLTVEDLPKAVVEGDRPVLRRMTSSLLWAAFRSVTANGSIVVSVRHEAPAEVRLVVGCSAKTNATETELEHVPGLFFASRMLAAHGGKLHLIHAGEWPTSLIAALPTTAALAT